MSTTIYPLRLSPNERKELNRAAKQSRVTLAEFLREAGLARAHQTQYRRAAILTYPDKLELSTEAEQNPKAFISRKLEAKRELHS